MAERKPSQPAVHKVKRAQAGVRPAPRTAPARVGIEAEVVARAIEVIGNKAEAMRWLGTPVRDLGYATPMSLLYNRKGCDSVLATLVRLEHGVF